MDGNEEDWFGDDPSHPIPYIFVLDIHAKAADGAGQLEMVIASPLRNDRRSKERLLRKFDVYLNFVQSEEWREEHGEPSLENSRLNISINDRSDPEMLDLLENCRTWVEKENKTSLTIMQRKY